MSADIDIDLADRDQLLKLIDSTAARQLHQTWQGTFAEYVREMLQKAGW
jgi:hypothetical protein